MTEVQDSHRSLPDNVEFIDCSLRDGEQAAGVWFTIEEKVMLAELLSEAGINALDAGFPGANGSDMEAMQEMRRRNLRSRLCGSARPLKRDIAATEMAGADEVFLFLPTSKERLRETLGVDTNGAFRMFLAGSEEVRARGMELSIVMEDATRANPIHLISIVERLLKRVTLSRLVLCDTVGASYPMAIRQLFKRFHDVFGPEINLCPHCHNDFGLAVANTLAAVEAGATAVTCTVNSIGERAGNADLAEVAAALTHIYGVANTIAPHQLLTLAEAVERMSGIHTAANKPVTGFNVYRHESGIHVEAMLKRRESYEFLPAEWTGRRSEFVLGKHSGSALICHLLKNRGVVVAKDEVASILKALKAYAMNQSKELHAAAFAAASAARERLLAGLSANDLGELTLDVGKYKSTHQTLAISATRSPSQSVRREKTVTLPK